MSKSKWLQRFKLKKTPLLKLSN